MSQGKSKWEEFIEISEDYPCADLAERAIQEIKAREETKKNRWIVRYWKPIAVCAATFIIGIGVGLPVYHALNTPTMVYYETDDLKFKQVHDVNLFFEENELSVCYYDTSIATTQCAIIKDTDEIAFLVQDVFNITDVGFDTVNLISVVKENAQFDFCDKFSEIEETMVVDNIMVSYQVIQNMGMTESQVFAKFTYQDVEYYMEILTECEAEESIGTYVSMLIG